MRRGRRKWKSNNRLVVRLSTCLYLTSCTTKRGRPAQRPEKREKRMPRERRENTERNDSRTPRDGMHKARQSERQGFVGSRYVAPRRLNTFTHVLSCPVMARSMTRRLLSTWLDQILGLAWLGFCSGSGNKKRTDRISCSR